MKNIVYLSTAVKLMNDDQLIEILETARQNNSKQDITGVLLYSEGTFLQVLEGEESCIDAIFSAIETDPRHKNIITLIDGPIIQKNFKDWSMGFSHARADKVQDLVGYLKSDDAINGKDGNSAAATTLKTFIDSNKLQITY